MKSVIQKEKTGCGIASVAAIAGVSYNEANTEADKLGIYASDPKLWSDTKYVLDLLKEFGVNTSQRKTTFKLWEKLPDLALLAIKWHVESGIPFWHWTVFVRENGKSYVLDPKASLKSNKRTDFGRMKPKWYIEVNK
ncbi:MAG: cysteine peptidase family C39 domain-containing protein [Thermodesulfobacteriota bacterium]